MTCENCWTDGMIEFYPANVMVFIDEGTKLPDLYRLLPLETAPEVFARCPTCNQTGKVPTIYEQVTVEDAIAWAKPIKLETRLSPKTGRLRIKIDDRWRHSHQWIVDCCSEACNRNDPELEFFGRRDIDTGDMLFWGVCPDCGWETRTYWIGYKEPRPAGGMGHGHLRNRRMNSGC